MVIEQAMGVQGNRGDAAHEVLKAFVERAKASGLLLRDFSGRDGLGGAVRISIGTPDQNNRLLLALRAVAT